MSLPVIVGRSSSHFTRVVRIFALELGIAHDFTPVLDIRSLDVADYSGNPALKVPSLVDERGPLFGVKNICRELARRAGGGPEVILFGALEDRLVANAEELVLHAMDAEVALITASFSPDPKSPPPKVLRSLENTLTWLDEHVDAAVAALPEGRSFSFVETALFCLVTHFPFRNTLDVTPWKRLGAFAERFGQRESARNTPYRFDAA